MDSKHIFDVIGRQIKGQVGGLSGEDVDRIKGINEIDVDKKLYQFEKEKLKKKFTIAFNQFGDHLQKTDKIVKTIKISKHYVTLNGKKENSWCQRKHR